MGRTGKGRREEEKRGKGEKGRGTGADGRQGEKVGEKEGKDRIEEKGREPPERISPRFQIRGAGW